MLSEEVRSKLKRLREAAPKDAEDMAKEINLRPTKTHKTAASRYLAFERGDVDLSWRQMERLLSALLVAGRLRDECEGPYAFGCLLREFLRKKGVRQKDIAKIVSGDEYLINRLVNGTVPPQNVDIILRIAEALELTEEETVSLHRAAGFRYESLDLHDAEPEEIEAVERLLEQMQRGVGEQREGIPNMPLPQAEETREGSSENSVYRGRQQVLAAANDMIYSAANRSTKTPVRICVGHYLGEVDDHSLREIRNNIRFILNKGQDVELLLESADDAGIVSDCVVEALDFFSLGGEYRPRVYHKSDVVDLPLKMIKADKNGVLMFWPREGDGAEDQEKARLLADNGNAFEEHFKRRYGQARVLADFFLDDGSAHVKLERALFAAEENADGRFLVKGSINSLMVPYKARNWERQYLSRKYPGRMSKGEFDEFYEYKMRRVKNLRSKLSSHKCYNVCSRAVLEDFFQNDGRYVESFERQSTVEYRIAVINQVLHWLKFENYMLILAEDPGVTATGFEIAPSESVFIQVSGEGRQDFHLQINVPVLEKALQGYFLEIWRGLSSREKSRRNTVRFLKMMRRRLQAQT